MKISEAKKLVSIEERIKRFLSGKNDEVFLLKELTEILKENSSSVSAALSRMVQKKVIERHSFGVWKYVYGTKEAIKKLEASL